MQEQICEIRILHREQEIGRYALVPGEYTVGRSSECSIPVKVDSVSRLHARVVVAKNGGASTIRHASADEGMTMSRGC